MEIKKQKNIKITNWKMISTIGGTIGCAILAVGLYFYLTSHGTYDETSSLNSSAQNSKKEQIASDYVKKNRDAYEKKQAQLAAKHNQSHFTLGSMNEIKPIKPQIINAHDNSAYNYQKELQERNKRQANTQTQAVTTTPSENLDKSSLSPAFLTALHDIASGKNENPVDTQKSTFTTVATPDYVDSSITTSIKSSISHVIATITAGTTLYGSIVNTVNSDFKNTPVVATVELGKYRGATLIGKFETNNEWVTGISITFDTMIFKGQEFTGIKAIAINADYKPSLYDDIDNHWFQRIGGLVIGAGLGAVKGAADQYSGTNQTVILTDGGGAAPVGQKPDAKQLQIGAAGGAAGDVSSQLKPVFTKMWNRPTTITVDSGHAIGILFVSTAELKTQKS